MECAVERPPPVCDLGGERREVVRVVDVKLDHVGGRGQRLGGALGQATSTPESGEQHLGAALLCEPCDGVGDRVPVQDAGDQQLAAFEHHEASSAWVAVGRAPARQRTSTFAAQAR
ncbi:unannotated protein [freshwater metagenome]|uniref:Unannotated protein n=1 Tax=freshwater metagenome TaxID=449393 RepID=A0A6J7EG64_9ZZZZ